MTFEEWKENRHMNGIYWGDLKAAWEESAKAEREACAKVGIPQVLRAGNSGETEMTDKLLQRREEHLTAIHHITARMDALHAGEVKYNGAPCKNGHAGLRYTKSDCCVECMMVRNDMRGAP